MPALAVNPALDNVFYHGASIVGRDDATNETIAKTWEVVCAWPVSGQYGPGTRILYYVLVAACVLARKKEWLRNACLAAALILPAVAAIHGVVLAAVHVDAKVDMDVYGALQLCSIGILAAPVTVRLSTTYWNNSGRNIIFVWTSLILAGLLSLVVEFYRAAPVPCTESVPRNTAGFPYENALNCSLICDEKLGAPSPLRGGAGDDIFIIPAPEKFTFGAATLLAAACCIPAVLSMVSMWDKIVQINTRLRFGHKHVDANAPIQGTRATEGEMKGVNAVIRQFLNAIEIPLFSGAVLAILIVGEINFWSDQVKFKTEPMESVGQWAPIVASALAACGSLYMLLAEDIDATNSEATPDSISHHPRGRSTHARHLSASPTPPEMSQIRVPGGVRERGECLSAVDSGSSTTPWTGVLGLNRRASGADAGNRRKVAQALTTLSNAFGTASSDRYNDSEFKQGPALDFPEIPGEPYRNRDLSQIREQYNKRVDGISTPGRRSRASSRNRSTASARRAPLTTHNSGSFFLSPPTSARPPLQVATADPDHGISPPTESRAATGADCLAVPSPAHLAPPPTSPTTPSPPVVKIPGSPSSPRVVVSFDDASSFFPAGPSSPPTSPG
ncbi:hypothetical protein QBC39DRAFT_100959 [Podospora conica]|nr:hypothetical protein QBC39DRAFT_100959 [Schizothecium conicum]